MFNTKNNSYTPVRSTISVLNAFRAVFDFLQNEGALLRGCTAAHKYLMDMYDITIGGVEAIAYLLHFHPTEISGSKLITFPRNRDESPTALFEELKSRGFNDVDFFDDSNAGIVNDYGRFRYVFDDEQTAKEVVSSELKQMVYPFFHILNKEEAVEWKRYVSMLYGDDDPVCKVVYNAAVSGGLHLSERAIGWLRERGMEFDVESTCKYGPFVGIPRHNPLLVKCIETLGEDANGPENGWTPKAELHVATISGTYYYIDDHDGGG